MMEKDENYIANSEEKIKREITPQTNTEAETTNFRGSIEFKSIQNNDVSKEKQYKKINSAKLSPDSKYKNESCLTRLDSFGNPILKNGRQKISFIDKISNNKFVDEIKIESFKSYNKMEEISTSNMQNTCCFIA